MVPISAPSASRNLMGRSLSLEVSSRVPAEQGGRRQSHGRGACCALVAGSRAGTQMLKGCKQLSTCAYLPALPLE